MNYRKLILIALGLFLVFALFFKNNFNVKASDIIEKEITVKIIRDIGNKNSNDAFAFYSENYPCEFIIDNSGGCASEWKIEEKIKVNDKLLIRINKSELKNLYKKGKIYIYSLNKNKSYLFTFENYLSERNSRNKRYDILGYIVLIYIIYRLLKPENKGSR